MIGLAPLRTDITIHTTTLALQLQASPLTGIANVGAWPQLS